MINGNLSRRLFISSALAIIPTLSFASLYKTEEVEDYLIIKDIINSFPRRDEIISDSNIVKTHFLGVKFNVPDYGLTFKEVEIDHTEHYKIDKIFYESLTTREINKEPYPSVSAVISAANKVAMQTRRGKGNNYSVFSDHILVWYMGKGDAKIYDTPAQRIGNNIAYNPLYKDYFVRVYDVKLTDDDHERLKQLNFNRI